MKRPKTAGSILAALGFLAGSTTTLVVNPGNITTDEVRVLIGDWEKVLLEKREFENTAGQLDWVRRELDEEEAAPYVLPLWNRMRSVWEELDDSLDTFARDFHDAYRFDELETGALEPDYDGNKVVKLVQDARAAFTPGVEALVINLPPGRVQAFVLGRRDRRNEVDCSFLGETTLVLQGNGTEVMPEHSERGWGTTITVQAAGDWDGRVHFRDLTIYASGGNSVSSISAFGSRTTFTPYKDLRFERCRFLDHPVSEVDCIRPISVNHAAISAIECFVDMPNSREHWIYSRNPFNAPQVIEGNTVVAVGGQILQFVSRPHEGPTYGPSLVTVKENDFRNYHRYCERAATAITIAGSGQDWLIEGNIVTDEGDGGCFKDHASGGSLVAWTGGSFWEYGQGPGEAIAVERGQTPPPGVRSNGSIIIRGNVFSQPNPDRSTISLKDCASATVEGNAILGKHCDIRLDAVPVLEWDGNNTLALVEHAIELEVSDGSGQNADVRRESDRQVIAKITDRIALP